MDNLSKEISPKNVLSVNEFQQVWKINKSAEQINKEAGNDVTMSKEIQKFIAQKMVQNVRFQIDQKIVLEKNTDDIESKSPPLFSCSSFCDYISQLQLSPNNRYLFTEYGEQLFFIDLLQNKILQQVGTSSDQSSSLVQFTPYRVQAEFSHDSTLCLCKCNKDYILVNLYNNTLNIKKCFKNIFNAKFLYLSENRKKPTHIWLRYSGEFGSREKCNVYYLETDKEVKFRDNVHISDDGKYCIEIEPNVFWGTHDITIDFLKNNVIKSKEYRVKYKSRDDADYNHLFFLPGNKFIGMLRRGGCSLSIYAVKDWKEICSFSSCNDPILHKASPDEELYIVADTSAIFVIHTHTGILLKLVRGIPINFSPNGRFFVVKSRLNDFVYIYDTHTWKYKKINGSVRSHDTIFTHDDSLLLLKSNNDLVLWDTHEWSEKTRIKDVHKNAPFAISSDGMFVVIEDNQTIKICSTYLTHNSIQWIKDNLLPEQAAIIQRASTGKTKLTKKERIDIFKTFPDYVQKYLIARFGILIELKKT